MTVTRSSLVSKMLQAEHRWNDKHGVQILDWNRYNGTRTGNETNGMTGHLKHGMRASKLEIKTGLILLQFIQTVSRSRTAKEIRLITNENTVLPRLKRHGYLTNGVRVSAPLINFDPKGESRRLARTLICLDWDV